jgi:ribosomal protein S19
MFLVYTGMTFVYCQLTEEWHLGVANLHRNDISIWPSYVGMTFVCCHLAH